MHFALAYVDQSGKMTWPLRPTSSIVEAASMALWYESRGYTCVNIVFTVDQTVLVYGLEPYHA